MKLRRFKKDEKIKISFIYHHMSIVVSSTVCQENQHFCFLNPFSIEIIVLLNKTKTMKYELAKQNEFCSFWIHSTWKEERLDFLLEEGRVPVPAFLLIPPLEDEKIPGRKRLRFFYNFYELAFQSNVVLKFKS